MKRKKFIFIILALTTTATAEAQHFSAGSISNSLQGKMRGDDRKFGNLTGEKTPIVRTYVENKDLHSADRWTADTVYYAAIERRSSWIVGKGEPLEKKNLTDSRPYYMLTRKNNGGHYLRVERLGAPAEAPLEMQNLFAGLLDDYEFDEDYLKSLDWWFEKGRDIRRIDFSPSADGSRVSVETAFASDGSRAHTVHYEQTSKNRAVAFCVSHSNLTFLGGNDYTGPDGIIIDYQPDGSYKKLTPIDATGWPIVKK